VYMTKQRVKILGVAAVTGCAIGAMIAHMPHAHAEPFSDPSHQHDMSVACTDLAENPTFGGILTFISQWQHSEGTSAAAAALGTQTLLDAVDYDCPQYTSLLKAWVLTLPDPDGTPAKPQPPMAPGEGNKATNVGTVI
jgi:hypothetical protein